MNNIYAKKLKEDGCLLIKNFFSENEKEKIVNFKKKLENLPEEIGKWMIYFEEIDNVKVKSRIENFYNFDNEIKDFVDSKILPFLEKICENKMLLFKDKMNWKYPKGDGFKAHQDHPAWNDFNISRFYSVALFADNATVENGCLEIVKGKNNIGEINSSGCIPENIAENFNWEYVEATSYDLFIFDSFIPHKSSKNISNKSRSIFYFTFNKFNEGNHYDEYISNKRKYFPPPIERKCDEVKILNNKYNLGNPLK